MTTARGPAWRAALGGGAALAVATPPAVWPGAEFLVFAGLAAWFAIATAGARPFRHTMLLGCVHMVWFSWSVHHALASFLGPIGMVPAFLGIVVLGGLYFVLGTVAVRRLPPRLAAVGFALMSAGSFWLRANMPEIAYPHGQPCHTLWQWPVLLGSLRLGGESLANVLCAWLAAVVVEWWRSWRIGAPPWHAGKRGFGIAAVVACAATVVGNLLEVAPPDAERRSVSVAAVEPGLHCLDPYLGLGREESRRTHRAAVNERLIGPTRAMLADGRAPDLVLWPESSLALWLDGADIDAGEVVIDLPRMPIDALVGTNVDHDRRSTPAAVLVDLRNGRAKGHHEKTCLVPGGEFLPVLRRLPTALREPVYDALSPLFGMPADCVAGAQRAPLELADGTRFGSLLCYDNAYPAPAAAYVAAGARFLCVLSNESWFRGGSELTQLVASSVCRALETCTPLVRCTTDGWTAAVSADGRVLADLPVRPSPAAAARILRIDVPLGAGVLPPMAWLRAWSGPAVGCLLLAALLHALVAWARLRSNRIVTRPN
ncbi:MAG: apolipoprotein N-acyltransferase [Planctomycetes bacterium]|nr:apolipoprotein N-acyltransferase [Planctomycetota bacterium]